MMPAKKGHQTQILMKGKTEEVTRGMIGSKVRDG